MEPRDYCITRVSRAWHIVATGEFGDGFRRARADVVLPVLQAIQNPSKRSESAKVAPTRLTDELPIRKGGYSQTPHVPKVSTLISLSGSLPTVCLTEAHGDGGRAFPMKSLTPMDYCVMN